jgi:SAM-dependent methyltransferase
MTYVHGYSDEEAGRLTDQANTLAALLHQGTTFPAGSRVLEVGCGVGSQTVFLASGSPEALFTSIDISQESLEEARSKVSQRGLRNVSFQQANIFDLPFEQESFDHLFLCFVLEHLPNPESALAVLKKVLKPQGTVTVIEGDHGSAYFHPTSPYAQQAIQCLVDLQASMGGDSLIGRRLFPLLTVAGYNDVAVHPRMVYVDGSKPELIDGFTKKTFTAMVEGVRDEALNRKLMSEQDWDRGIADLYRTAETDGVFCYTFFKARARK